MGTENLDKIFDPKRIALIGASERANLAILFNFCSNATNTIFEKR
jgi:acyl-CoA synthetase (NDP forming)